MEKPSASTLEDRLDALERNLSINPIFAPRRSWRGLRKSDPHRLLFAHKADAKTDLKEPEIEAEL
jgi:hypothetical protein